MEPFATIKGRFGFGCMRLPMKDDHVDEEQFKVMVDHFMAKGFNYFDTATVYISGESETALKHCLTSRYPRESYSFTNKCSGSCFEKEEDLEPYFQRQLDACGLEYFDFYLMHAQGRGNFEKYKRCHAYEFAFQKKKEGKIKHVGISFHDSPDFLRMILTEYPEIEVVQIQFNYYDTDNPDVESLACYKICEEFHKPVIVMEPVKGGSLVRLPEEAAKPLLDLNGGSLASYAIRFVLGFPQIFMVLSGMSDIAQMDDNLSYTMDFVPLNEKELAAIEEVKRRIREEAMIPCTACRYCVDGCPMKIDIPRIFKCLNDKTVFKNPWASFSYGRVTSEGKGKASQCIECGQCEDACPQHLPIRSLLKNAAKEFE